MCLVRPLPRTSIRRSWYKYSPEMLCAGLSKVDWSNTATDVQGVWNDFENKLIMVVDDLIPLSDFKNNIQVKLPSQLIKKKLSLRKRLRKNFKRNPTLDLKHRIKSLNIEIQKHFYSEKRFKVRKKLKPGNSKSLWDAVNSAKDKLFN